MALFCVATVCAQEPNPEQLFRDAQYLYYRLHHSEDGAREQHIVERISEQERQNKTKAKVISPVLPSP
jgi:hypothetical protein